MLHSAVGLEVGRGLALLAENAAYISESKYVELLSGSGYLTGWARVLLLELVHAVLEVLSEFGVRHVAVLDHEVSLAVENIIDRGATAYRVPLFFEGLHGICHLHRVIRIDSHFVQGKFAGFTLVIQQSISQFLHLLAAQIFKPKFVIVVDFEPLQILVLGLI